MREQDDIDPEQHYIDPITRTFYSASRGLQDKTDVAVSLADAAKLICEAMPTMLSYIKRDLPGGVKDNVLQVFNWAAQMESVVSSPYWEREAGVERAIAVSSTLPTAMSGQSTDELNVFLLNSIMSVRSEHRTELMHDVASALVVNGVHNLMHHYYFGN